MKKNNKSAESLVGIIVGVFILSFVLLGIGKLIGNSKDTISEFDTKMTIDLLGNNASQIINTLDLSSLYDGDVFYLYKDKANKKFNIYIGEQNRQYKYINKFGEKINPNNYKGTIYTRLFQTKKININGEEKTAVKILVKKLIK